MSLTRLYLSLGDKLKIRAGLNGNYYAVGRDPQPLRELCRKIGKAPGSVYWNKRHSCWAVRIRLKAHQAKLKEIFANTAGPK